MALDDITGHSGHCALNTARSPSLKPDLSAIWSLEYSIPTWHDHEFDDELREVVGRPWIVSKRESGSNGSLPFKFIQSKTEYLPSRKLYCNDENPRKASPSIVGPPRGACTASFIVTLRVMRPPRCVLYISTS